MCDTIILKQNFSVPFAYEVLFSYDVFKPVNKVLLQTLTRLETGRKHRIMFFIEDQLCEFYPKLCSEIECYALSYPESIQLSSQPVVIGGGEENKSLNKISDLCELMAENRLCRQSFVGIIGGGAFIDTVGLAASLAHRGLRQIRFPTTVLAQNDSGVGVKCGVNMFGVKNFLGCFAPPFAVINDLRFLNSLSDRDWISGVAEALKVALIKDAEFFHWLVDNSASLVARDEEKMARLVQRCAELHLKHIRSSGDPFEFGSARPLDFGHWAAHKLEMMSGGAIRHGEAVAIGLLLDSHYAKSRGLLEQKHLDLLIQTLKVLNFKCWVPELELRNANGDLCLFDGLDDFKEHLGGELYLTLPNGLGEKLEVTKVDKQLWVDALNVLKNIESTNAASK